jgi:hypothetical protein
VVRLRARIELLGVNPFVWVRSTVLSELGRTGRGPLPVVFWAPDAPETTWHTNLMPSGEGDFRLYLNGVVRAATRTVVGDHLELEIRWDRDYRGGPTHAPPPRFTEGLLRSTRARRAWEALPPSRRKEVLRYLANLKSAPARERNVDRALRALSGAPIRFLGRDWNAPAEREAGAASREDRERRRSGRTGTKR